VADGCVEHSLSIRQCYEREESGHPLDRETALLV